MGNNIPQIKKSPQTNTVPIFSVSLPRISCTSAIKASFIALGLHYPCRTNINPINKSRKLMTHWSILTFVMTFAFCHNVQGQVNYTYNDTGCCTSRTKAQNVAKVQTALYRLQKERSTLSTARAPASPRLPSITTATAGRCAPLPMPRSAGKCMPT